MANQLFQGYVHTGAGVAVEGATVILLDRNTTSPTRASTTTSSTGLWTISYATEGRFDIKITNGSSVAWLKYDDQIQMDTVEVANLRVRNPANTFDYDLVPSAITADRTQTLPLVTVDSTVATVENILPLIMVLS